MILIGYFAHFTRFVAMLQALGFERREAMGIAQIAAAYREDARRFL